jgi:hypothetical protein
MLYGKGCRDSLEVTQNGLAKGNNQKLMATPCAAKESISNEFCSHGYKQIRHLPVIKETTTVQCKTRLTVIMRNFNNHLKGESKQNDKYQ